MGIKFDVEAIQLLSLFENVTRVKARDSFSDNNYLIFIVGIGEAGRAVGKGGANIKRLAAMLKKKIKIVEHSDDLVTFIGNMIYPLKVDSAGADENNIVTLKSDDTKTKGLIIGKNAQNLRKLEENVKRYFPQLKEIKVV